MEQASGDPEMGLSDRYVHERLLVARISVAGRYLDNWNYPRGPLMRKRGNIEDQERIFDQSSGCSPVVQLGGQ